MSHLRSSPFRLALVSLCAALFVSGCSSSAAAPSQTPVGFFDTHEWRVTVRNQTDRYVWLSKYWTHSLVHGWHLENYSECIAPHGETTTSIEYHNPTDAGAKLRAEIKPATAGRHDCSGDDNDADIYGNTCDDRLFLAKDLSRQWDVVRAEAFVKYEDSKWILPTSCDVAHW